MKQKSVGIRIVITLVIALAAATNITAQDTKKTNYFSFEIGGSGGLGSINIERPFLQKEKSSFSWRAGLSFAPIDKNNGFGIVFPIMVHGVFGQNAHKIDAGFGQGITITTRGQFFARMPLSFGYRFQPTDKRYYLRIAYTPLVSYLVDFQFQHWGGITFGYTFKKP